MDEYFLHFLWKFQKFNTRQLQLSSGKPLLVFHPGHTNSNAGPDFLEAKIKIEELEWAGSVEVHYRSSDWYRHKHQHDPAYQNVVLHVVWEDDRDVTLLDGSVLPTLELAKYVSSSLETEYRKYINQPETIRCKDHLPGFPRVRLFALLDAASAERLRHKTLRIMKIYQSCQDDWEETAYRMLARNFGFAINGEVFQKWAETLPLRILRKHADNPTQVFALTFGQAGMLDAAPVDEYQETLAKEYRFLKKKYELRTGLLQHQWKFSRLRPANFPTVRLAQLATLLCTEKQFFQKLISIGIDDIKKVFHYDLPDYWMHHYDFGKAAKKPNRLGKSSIENLLINTSAPLLAAYGRFIDEPKYFDKAVELLESLSPEQNNVTQKWSEVRVRAKSAFDTQALLHQYREYCIKKKCLQCSIGVSILNQRS